MIEILCKFVQEMRLDEIDVIERNSYGMWWWIYNEYAEYFERFSPFLV